LGALGSVEALPLLEQFSTHSAPEISETCKIAVDLINWRNKEGGVSTSGSYLSVDPAPPFQAGTLTVEECQIILVNESLSLFERYRAMFSLRNMNTDASALALEAGFADSSALFRHEIAYVLGQMQRECSVEGLAKVLRKEEEHEMVRHEAAEALGAIGNQTCQDILKVYEDDSAQVVKESCAVALDTIDYWHGESSSSA
jgi:deoxyhypusine monooxygenase